jgi:hypothetical protein
MMFCLCCWVGLRKKLEARAGFEATVLPWVGSSASPLCLTSPEIERLLDVLEATWNKKGRKMPGIES